MIYGVGKDRHDLDEETLQSFSKHIEHGRV